MPRSANPTPSAAPTAYRRLCAWCRTDLGPLWPGSQANSYGICIACTQRYFPDLYDSDGTDTQTFLRPGDADEAPNAVAGADSAVQSREVASTEDHKDE
jgi:hypothetical protein